MSAAHRPAAVYAPPQIPLPAAAEDVSGIRKIAFYACLAMVFARFAILPEIMVLLTGANTYILYLVGPPAILGCLVTGGFIKSLRARPVIYWSIFYLFMVAATPFSSWPGASAQKVFGYLRTDLICLYVIAGVVLTWKEVTSMVKALSLSAFSVLLISRFFARADAEGRLNLDLGFNGIISNSNDLAAHIVLLLPFALLPMLKPGRNVLARALMLGSVFFGLWIVLGTSSRGAMLGLFAMAAFFFYRLKGSQRVLVMIMVPVLGVILLLVLPQANLARLATLFGSKPDLVEGGYDEAGESMATREYLFRQSIKFTLEHPLFGVGPTQFSNFEGLSAKASGEHGSWHETHNTYTQISSECGIPALIFAVAALIGVVVAVNKTFKAAAAAHDTEVYNICLCYLAAMIGYLVTITFLACAYRFTLPAMIGVGVAISVAGQKRLAAGGAGVTPLASRAA
ncbi:MAG: O-antigen ligase family protein [Acidobacteriota bacterium]|nr:O-antigen ligase family protein [Acidobacteriota bacterium]